MIKYLVKISLLLLAVALFNSNSFSQNLIKGKVVLSESSTPIVGAKIEIVATTFQTLSENNGSFTLSVPLSAKLQIQISYPSFITKTIDVIPLENSVTDLGNIDLAYDFVNVSLSDLQNVKVKVASTIPKNIFDSPSTVTVIDRETIERYHFMSVADAVRIASGIEILQSNLDRNIPTIRGILQNYYANKILIMINNIPSWQPVYGNGTLDRIFINDVEKIEILKGPASVLYGTNAYNGVINIILREINSTKLNAKVDAGYPGLSSTSINLSLAQNNWKLFLAGNTNFENRKPYLTTAANDSILMGNKYLYGKETKYYYNEEYRQYSINLITEYKQHTLLFNTFNNTYTYPGVNISYATGGNLPFTDLGSLIGYSFKEKFSDFFSLYFMTNYEYFFREWGSNPDRTKSLQLSAQRINSTIKSNFIVNSYFDLEIGADFLSGSSFGHHEIAVLQDTTVRHNMKLDKDIVEWALFGQANFKVDNFTFLIGSRYTGNQVFGSNLSSRLTAVWRPNNSNSIKLVLGQSFRTPTMLELYFDHPTVVGNNNLKPETNSSLELIYISSFIPNTFLQFTSFRSTYQNLIQRVRPDISKPAEYRNVEAFDGWGFECETKYSNSKLLNAFVNYTYIEGIGANAYSNFRFVPASTISMGLHKELFHFSASINCHAYSATSGLLGNIPAQFMADFHLSYSHFLESFNLLHTFSILNFTGSSMLIPEYIRQRKNINFIPTMEYGTRYVYSLSIEY